ncbi:pleckstrin-like protein domain-containing family F member 2-like [Sarcoptes scabiei]|nr:pleckstrin-like protein domain-containing family F member 2-like [Sarcoptes scabiei]
MNNNDGRDSFLISNFDPSRPFKPKRALVLGKLSRYEFEKHRNPNIDEKQLMTNIENNGSDYKSLLHHHRIHEQNKQHIVKCLEEKNIETKVVNRFGYSKELIDWSDIIITSGGDGTFLLAANKIPDNKKPLIGVNSDPTRSIGHLCLPKYYSDKFDIALNSIFSGNFEWNFRKRIRITLEGESSFDDPVELHDQQLMQHECRFLDLESISQPTRPTKIKNTSQQISKKRILPHLALNEVFVGESLSSRVSYFEMRVDDKEEFKIKSSGTTICTGTGSTSWFFNINKLTSQCVSNLFSIINEENFQGKCVLDASDQEMIQRVTDRFNNALIFSPSELMMAYVIRDPVMFRTNLSCNPKDFARKIAIKSRMTDAHLVIDGGLSYAFNDGSRAIFEMFEQDALRTINLIE